MSWSDEALKLKREQAKPPKGCQTRAEIAAELGVGEDRAGTIIADLVKRGRAERIPGRMLTPSGQLVPTLYYRLVSVKK
jgi:hypothetical protein